jgi:hypothetical protein
MNKHHANKSDVLESPEQTGQENKRVKSVELGQWLSEMKKAYARLRAWPNVNGQMNVHKPEDAALRWALSFAKIDLKDLSEGDFANRQRELACFSKFQMQEPVVPTNLVQPGRWPTWQELRCTQQWLQTTFTAIKSRETIRFTAPVKQWGAVFSSQRKRWETYWIEDWVVGPGVIELFALIRERLNRLRECRADDCGNLFLADRTNQGFCSKRCMWRHTQRKALKISPERYGKRGRPRKTLRGVKHRRKRDGTKR